MRIELLTADSYAWQELVDAVNDAVPYGRDIRLSFGENTDGDRFVKVKVGGGMWSPPLRVQDGSS